MTDQLNGAGRAHRPAASHLFLVRLWTENNNQGDAVWCGKVQHVTRGKANRFRDWPTLIDLLVRMLPAAERVKHLNALHSNRDPNTGI